MDGHNTAKPSDFKYRNPYIVDATYLICPQQVTALAVAGGTGLIHMKIEFGEEEVEEIKGWMFRHLIHHAVSEPLYDKIMHPEKYQKEDL